MRFDSDRSPEALAFLAAVDAVCEEHGFTIGHEDEHGSFVITLGSAYRYWFLDAAEEVL